MTGQPANIAGETLAWQRVAPYKDSANLQHAEVNREGSQVTLPLRHRPSPLQGGHLDIAVAFQGWRSPRSPYEKKKEAKTKCTPTLSAYRNTHNPNDQPVR